MRLRKLFDGKMTPFVSAILSRIFSCRGNFSTNGNIGPFALRSVMLNTYRSYARGSKPRTSIPGIGQLEKAGTPNERNPCKRHSVA
jgi:hypothetical protein